MLVMPKYMNYIQQFLELKTYIHKKMLVFQQKNK